MLNRKPGSMIRNTLKYQRVDLERRQELRAQWNRPVVWPLGLVALLFVIIVAPAFLHYRRRERATGVGGVA